MKHSFAVLSVGVSLVMMAVFCVHAEDDMDPDLKAAMDAAKKAAGDGNAGNPAVNKMLENAKKQAEKEESDATPTPAPATPPKPLKALPAWIPPVPGFKPSPGATCWTEAGMEKGQMTGTVPGAPRDVTKAYADLVKAANKLNCAVNDVTLNNALTMTVFLTSREGDERKLELTLKPSPDGKMSLATFEYSAALPGSKPAGD